MRLLSGKTGQSMIACVDADYDYLIQGKTETSRAVISNPYVFSATLHRSTRSALP